MELNFHGISLSRPSESQENNWGQRPNIVYGFNLPQSIENLGSTQWAHSSSIPNELTKHLSYPFRF